MSPDASPLLTDDAALASALALLSAEDPALATALAEAGAPPLRRWPTGFATLADVIIGQQVSTRAATAIKTRLRAQIDPLTPEGVLATTEEDLRACGLSRQKITYLCDLAGQIADGRLDLTGLAGQEDEAIIAALTDVRGIGRWTAEIYLLFALGRPDAWPAEDLALAVAVQHIRGLDERPKGRMMRAHADAWRPWRGAAAHFLWHYYHHLTRRSAVLTVT